MYNYPIEINVMIFKKIEYSYYFKSYSLYYIMYSQISVFVLYYNNITYCLLSSAVTCKFVLFGVCVRKEGVPNG